MHVFFNHIGRHARTCGGKIFLNLVLAAGLLASSALAATFSNIDQMSGWQNCDVCSGKNQQGPTAPHSLTQYINGPSLDGRAMRFWLGGSTPYSSAYWWKTFGGTASRHFRYDLYFYMTSSGASEALEFDVNQNINGKRYVMGLECGLLTSRQWNIYDTANARWVPTGIGCSYIAPNRWHHLVAEVERTTDNRTHFVAVTLDGNKHYINRYMYPRSNSWYSVSVAVQLDGNKYMTDYALWADKITLTSW